MVDSPQAALAACGLPMGPEPGHNSRILGQHFPAGHAHLAFRSRHLLSSSSSVEDNPLSTTNQGPHHQIHEGIAQTSHLTTDSRTPPKLPSSLPLAVARESGWACTAMEVDREIDKVVLAGKALLVQHIEEHLLS